MSQVPCQQHYNISDLHVWFANTCIYMSSFCSFYWQILMYLQHSHVIGFVA